MGGRKGDQLRLPFTAVVQRLIERHTSRAATECSGANVGRDGGREWAAVVWWCWAFQLSVAQTRRRWHPARHPTRLQRPGRGEAADSGHTGQAECRRCAKVVPHGWRLRWTQRRAVSRLQAKFGMGGRLRTQIFCDGSKELGGAHPSSEQHGATFALHWYGRHSGSSQAAAQPSERAQSVEEKKKRSYVVVHWLYSLRLQ